ncbi:methylenetetrahydrofolate reductase C-terminal domain-containing protein [Thermosulfuriphilus sp.]
MIIAERKPLEEIYSMVSSFKKILVLGCRGCVAVCNAGGEKEVATLSEALKLAAKKAGQGLEIQEETFVRQCDPEYLEPLKELKEKVDAVVSMACGVGVNLVADLYPGLLVFPALNTTFYGANLAAGKWEEKCRGCGDCILHLTGGLCPIARCAKNLLNGPCGGSQGGRCEIRPDVPCVWHEIYDRLKALGRLEDMKQIMPAKDWTPAGHGGLRRRQREDLLAQQ